jgi:hypothetical protein
MKSSALPCSPLGANISTLHRPGTGQDSLYPQDYLFVLRAVVSRSAIFLCSPFSGGYNASAPPVAQKHPGPPATCACGPSAGRTGWLPVPIGHPFGATRRPDPYHDRTLSPASRRQLSACPDGQSRGHTIGVVILP